MKELGVNPFAYEYNVTHKTSDLQKSFVSLPNGQEDSSITVSIAGRIISRRVFGKLAFFELQDDTEFTDVGDIIGVTGTLKRTDKGELSVYTSTWTMLTKSLLPLPDKFHGLTDVNKRYRQRHLDMIVNPEVVRVMRTRAKIIRSIREILDNKNYIEIETPILNNQPGGAEAKPFETYHNALDMRLTLRIATELHLKRLIIGGIDRVYEIGRIFRNEGLSTRHNPEFTSIEIYQSYSDYNDMMKLTEDLVSTISTQLYDTTTIPYGNYTIDLSTPWERITMIDIVKRHTGYDFTDIIDSSDYNKAKQIASELDIHIDSKVKSAGEILNIIFEEKVESSLIQPVFVYDYPVEVSPLAKPHRNKKNIVERFEMFMVAREHANAFSELTDPIDQRNRFLLQAEKKAAGDEEACDVDEEFLQALESGMPPTAGLGIGIDRLVMVLTNSQSIKDVIAFPLLRKE
eukprot:gene19981-25951_t